MGLPLILYDLAPFTNPSFEDDPDATSPPTGWDAPTGSELRETDTDEAFDKGSGHGKLSSMLLENIVAEPIASAIQVSTWIPPVGTKIALVAVIKGNDGTETYEVKISERDGAQVQTAQSIASGLAVTTSWAAVYLSHTVFDTTSVDFRIRISNEIIPDKLWVDQFMMGRSVDFAEQEFINVDIIPVDRAALNIAPGAWEAVKLADTFSRIHIVMEGIIVGSAVDLALKAFRGWAGAYRRFAFWTDRDDHTNQGRHFAECILAPGTLPEKIPPGTFQYSTVMDFIAPNEWQAQEVD